MSHAKDFGTESGNADLANELIYDYRAAELPDNLRALCDYAVKLTLHPGDMVDSDVTELRQCGWSDEQIHIATQVVSYFNYINRVADGLGVDLEDWMVEPGVEQWRQSKGKFQSSVAKK